MTMTMIQADRNFASPSDDASLYSGLIGDHNGLLNRDNKMMISTSGLVATIGTGQAIIQGRLIKITAPEQLTLPANTAGVICLVIDLTQTNTVSGTAGEADYGVDVNQVYLAVVTGALTQDDLNNGGFIYDFPLASFTTTGNSIALSGLARLLNDSGWIDLSLAAGAKFVGSDPNVYYCRYRILNVIVYIQANGVNVTKALNSNQMFSIPAEIAPSKQFTGHGTSWTSGGRQVGVGIVMQPTASGVAFVNWNTTSGADGTNINTSFSYPLG